MSKVNASILTFMVVTVGLTVFFEGRNSSVPQQGVILFAGIVAWIVYAFKKDDSDTET
jgi:hypothetical protein